MEYLKTAGVEKLDYMIGTHLHEDHIGSMDTVIQNFDIQTVMLPKQMHTTDTYKDVLTAISDKGLKITTPIPEITFFLMVSIGNMNSKKFHKPSCRKLPSSKNQIEFAIREDTIQGGYTPCQMCNP